MLQSGIYYLQYTRNPLTVTSMTDEEILNSYMFIRLSNVESYESAVGRQVNGSLGDYQDLPGAVKRPDNSWELVVHREYATKLCAKLQKRFPSCCLQVDDDPMEPSQAGVNIYGYWAARSRAHYEFSKRLKQQLWPYAIRFYELRNVQELTRLLLVGIY